MKIEQDVIQFFHGLNEKSKRWENSDKKKSLLLSEIELYHGIDMIAQNQKHAKEILPIQKLFLFASYHFIEASRTQYTNYRDVFISHNPENSLTTFWEVFIYLAHRRFSICFHLADDYSLEVKCEEIIQDKIYKSKNIIFLITSRAVQPALFAKEHQYAIQYHKRIFPVLCTDFVEQDIAHEVNLLFQNRNWFHLSNQQEDIRNDLRRLVSLLESGRDYVNLHTIFLNKAIKWLSNQKDPSLLLKNKEVSQAEKWLSSNPENTNYPCRASSLHLEFVRESKQRCASSDVDVSEDQYKAEYQVWLSKAEAWKNNDKMSKLLLAERAINQAEFWLAKAEKRTTLRPVEVQRAYILASRKRIPKSKFKDIFISYGRKESKGFARKLHDRLQEQGYEVWFDQEDIPLGVDFQDQIDDGITKSHNFVFIISPHSIQSKYCQKEIELALKLNKRIIPILHIEPTTSWHQMNAMIQKLNWIYIREVYDPDTPHNDFLQIDDFEQGLCGLIDLVTQDEKYVKRHTQILNWALEWDKQKRFTEFLLTGKERQEAQKWLLHTFENQQSPCVPTVLQTEYLCASRKYAENDMTDVFLSYTTKDKAVAHLITNSLSRYCITAWLHHRDIPKATDFEQGIYQGIDQADNFLYLISEETVKSEWCEKELQHALKRNKRIIPVKLTEVDNQDLLPQVSNLQYIDLSETQNTDKLRDGINQIAREIDHEKRYFEQHKILLNQALRWQKQGQNDSILLRGFNLQNAQAWFSIGNKRSTYRPLLIHEQYITRSVAMSGRQNIEAFISYSQKDNDFARKLNQALQSNGKTTWFDQDSIAEGAYFEKEIHKGIESSDNFIFIISPDSIHSPYCANEVAYARQLNKRFFTINYRSVDPSAMPKALSSVQWIDFQNDFYSSFSQLIRNLDIDRDHVQAHNKWQHKALDWKKCHQDNSLLLRGIELEQAHIWLREVIEKDKSPQATELQIQFVERSQKEHLAEERNKRLIALLLRGLLVIAVLAGIGAMFFAINAKKAAHLAKEKERVALVEKAKAEKATQLALQEKERAEIAEYNAKKAEKIALTEKHNANQERERAITALQKAKEQKEKANQATQQALRAEEKAKQSEKKAWREKKNAEKQKNRAEASEKKALFNLYWYNAKNLALKSDLHDNPHEKAWLALASYDLVKAGHKMIGKPPKYMPEVLQSLQNAALAYNYTNGMVLSHKSEIRTIDIDYSREGRVFYVDDSQQQIVIAKVRAGDALNEEEIVVNQKISLLEETPLRVIAHDHTNIYYGTSSGKLIQYKDKQKTLIYDFREPIRGIKILPHQDFMIAFSKTKLVLIQAQQVVHTIALRRISQGVMVNQHDFIFADEQGQISCLHLDGTHKYQIEKVIKHPFPIKSIAYSKQKHMVAFGDARGNLRLVRLGKKAQVYTPLRAKYFPYKHKGHIVGLEFSPNSRFLASAGLDGLVMIWDLQEMDDDLDGIFKLVPVLIKNQEQIFSVAFDKQNQFLMYGGQRQLYIRPIQIHMIYDRLRTYMKKQNLFPKTNANNLWKYYNRGLSDTVKPRLEK